LSAERQTLMGQEFRAVMLIDMLSARIRKVLV
jgi:hypothetical protein